MVIDSNSNGEGVCGFLLVINKFLSRIAYKTWRYERQICLFSKTCK